MDKASSRIKQELDSLQVNTIVDYLGELSNVWSGTSVIRIEGHVVTRLSLIGGFNQVIHILSEKILLGRKRLMIIGNGGSAAIANHMLMDYINSGNMRTMDFTSPALLTCMANDYGWQNVFAVPIQKLADEGDILFAISSSGQSQNILNACDAAKEKKCIILTFSGMSQDNPLRLKGFLNFYVPSTHYGFVELTHEALLHGILDLLIKNKS